MRSGWRLNHLLIGRRSTIQSLVRKLAPLVQNPAAEPGDDSARSWSTPYRIGLFATAVVRLALHNDPGLRGEELACLQLDVWSRLTGDGGELLGETILSLSLAEDAEFCDGCSAGLTFAAALIAAENESEPHMRDVCAMWRAAIEQH